MTRDRLNRTPEDQEGSALMSPSHTSYLADGPLSSTVVDQSPLVSAKRNDFYGLDSTQDALATKLFSEGKH